MLLKVGDQAPCFVGKDQKDHNVLLTDFLGKKLVLYFYRKNDTPGCTTQACNLRDNYERLQKAGYEILGVSTDNTESHRQFIEKNQLPFRLIADPKHKIHELYGTWIPKFSCERKYWGATRVTFIIDETGKIERIINWVHKTNHAAQICPQS